VSTSAPYLLPAAAALVALAIGILLGRASRRRDRERIRELEVRLDARDGQIARLETAHAELEARAAAAEQEREQAVTELSAYQAEVVGHFRQTSDLLREMTLQYRNIYQHLARGAEVLCPEGALRIEPTAPIEGLPSAGPDEGLAFAEAGDGPLADDELLDEEPLALARRESPLQVDPRPEA
jgi:uncharacterized membrane-anchored protein YhcB (DUF1043 family)